VIVLALDTATADTAVALSRGDATLGTRRHVPQAGERPGHVAQALPLAAELLGEAGLRFSDVDLVAVGIGPGTFTGLRIGVATARALAHGAGAALVGVPTLAALAAGVDGHDGPVLACLDARRGELFAATWPDAAAATRGEDPHQGPVAIAPDDVAELLVHGAGVTGPWLAVGDGAIARRGDLEAAGASVPPDSDPRHSVDATVVAALARGPLRDRAPRDGDVLPLYVRAPDAVPTAIREAAR
jgi:tRNA threonylcarbamoyladenosine biosynthesis protein TsaB